MLLFNIFYCFCMFVTNISISGAHNSKRKYCYNAKPSPHYFYVKTKISLDLQIGISVHLSQRSLLFALILVFFIDYWNKPARIFLEKFDEFQVLLQRCPFSPYRKDGFVERDTSSIRKNARFNSVV